MKPCIKCAKCNPICPTFRESLDELYSPRGYLHLCELFAKGELAPSKELEKILQVCTLCKECEKNCPIGLDITQIISSSISKLAQQNTKG